MKIATYIGCPCFYYIFTKWISNVMRVFLNKQLISFQSDFGVVCLCQGKGSETFSHFKCLESGKIIQLRALLPASYGLDGRVLFHVPFLP